jgi:bacteriocin-like protein
MQTTDLNRSADSHQLRIDDLTPAGEELSEEELQRVTGGIRPDSGNPTYLGGEPGCWDPHLP